MRSIPEFEGLFLPEQTAQMELEPSFCILVLR
jgi:hypothetical protein